MKNIVATLTLFFATALSAQVAIGKTSISKIVMLIFNF
jgi:hypothetical protein